MKYYGNLYKKKKCVIQSYVFLLLSSYYCVPWKKLKVIKGGPFKGDNPTSNSYFPSQNTVEKKM